MEKVNDGPDLAIGASFNPVSWIRDLRPDEQKTLRACWAGWVLDGVDTQMYSFAIPILIASWGLTRSQAGAIGTTMLMASALGGWMAGYLSDRFGRVRTLQITIVWFAVFSFVSGLAQNFDQLLVARGLMGLGFGGEYAAGAVLLSESVRAQMRGKALGINATGFAVGWGIAALLFSAAFTLMPPFVAWRVLFMLGAIPALLVIYVRRYIHDPEIYQVEKLKSTSRTMSPFEIFKTGLVGRTLLCAAMSTCGQGAYFSIISWLPTYFSRERGLSAAITGGYVLVTAVGSFFGYLCAAYLADRLGRRRSIGLFCIGTVVMLLLYALAPAQEVLLLALGFPLGFFSAGAFSVMPTLFTETFPTYCRGLSLGFVHNFGRASGSFMPLLVGLLSGNWGLAAAIGLLAGGGYALMAICALSLPETRGRALD